ncbi:MAG TPA: tRNA (adenosine(37)-N6)-threonylcarbamoyltransferase complex dimerization subunit type 1 TsaB [Casimicrobiaceae bacterium]|jgi:tRNA threonylcarbamoyladenosine biosynthesis protein TsaB|nr:tRNA (adenosine(37)-N6)-threonylcarbamoyltransferase complex dimerization subunit type 1 TsaB [Casimicrobiaceae bacterium]
MRILAIDTSTETCAVALGDGLAWDERSVVAGNRHSDLLLPMIRALLDDHGATLAQLGGIAFGAGPGAFTGLRIACGVAQGLALGAGLPLVGVSTLEALAETARQRHAAGKVIAALDARAQEVYVAAYRYDGVRWHEAVAPAVIGPAEVMLPDGGGWTGVGSGFAAYPALRERCLPVLASCEPTLFPTATAIGTLALPRLAGGEGVAARDAAPIYLRHKVALTSAERAVGRGR